VVGGQLFGGSSEATRNGRLTTDNGQLTDPNMDQPPKIRLFIKPFCGWCAQAMDWLDDHSIPYEVLDVIADERAYEEMYRLSGQTLAPVIDVDGRILADFGARELAAFWKQLEQNSPTPRRNENLER
jgi:glutaredoxin